MLIDVSDVNTIPAEIEHKILEQFRLLSKDSVSKVKAYRIRYDSDVRVATEKYVGSIYYFGEQLIPMFEQHEMVCYHSTKVLNKDIILSDGLKTNEWNTYSNNIINTLSALGVGQEKAVEGVKIIKKQYDWKYPLQDREPQLCFYSDTSLLSEGIRAGYEQFCENIGGELARDALKEDYPDLYRYLRENGEAFLVKFRIPFSAIKSYHQDSIIYQFVAYFAGKYFWDYDYEIHFDGDTGKEIPAEDILELIPYTVNRYYFNE